VATFNWRDRSTPDWAIIYRRTEADLDTPHPPRLTSERAAEIHSALAHTTRLEAFRLLLRYAPFGLTAGDLARLLAVPHNTLSTHVARLVQADLVSSRKTGRTVIFLARPQTLTAATSYLFQGLKASHTTPPSARPATEIPALRPTHPMTDKTYSVLILCTGNSARSILAEALINREGAGRFKAYSAGSQPKDEPNPVGLDLLASLGYDTSGFRSKSWTEFAGPEAPQMDFIITVCDSAHGEACPHWPGHPLVAHWGIPDPAAVEGTADQKRAAFETTYRQLTQRVTALVNLPITDLSLPELRERLAEIGRMDGATDLALAG
jgi:protein-tyrosine-phosphatase/DNA-binding transcriptional ArsR family regulator